jgi:AcrR family transcriptional regulator
MSRRTTIQVSSRKLPKQARSTNLVASILAAAVQILEKEGATRFTTARVAERAGVSIGSLYQYFPNKAAILFALQIDEWRQTTEMLRKLLENTQQNPLERLRTVVHAFILSECEEAKVRIALSDAAPMYRDTPEAQDGKAGVVPCIRNFMREVLPEKTDTVRMLAGDVIMNTLFSLGKRFSECSRNQEEITIYADAVADMFCSYLHSLGK